MLVKDTFQMKKLMYNLSETFSSRRANNAECQILVKGTFKLEDILQKILIN